MSVQINIIAERTVLPRHDDHDAVGILTYDVTLVSSDGRTRRAGFGSRHDLTTYLNGVKAGIALCETERDRA